MGKQKMTPIGIACILLVLLVVAFMVRGSLREPEKIVLPPEPSTTEPSGPIVDNEAVDRVEVRPDTVQSAIEVLARPRVYTRTITVERYWSGGSGVSVITAAAADGCGLTSRRRTGRPAMSSPAMMRSTSGTAAAERSIPAPPRSRRTRSRGY